MLAGMAWSMCSSTWKSCSRGPGPERSLLPSPPSPHHPGCDARGSANTNHEDMPSPELADRALVDARAAESSAYESTFSRAVEHAIDERHEGPLVERGGMGAEVLVVGSERHGISSSLYGGRGDDDVRDGLRHRSRVWPASGALHWSSREQCRDHCQGRAELTMGRSQPPEQLPRIRRQLQKARNALSPMSYPAL